MRVHRTRSIVEIDHRSGRERERESLWETSSRFRDERPLWTSLCDARHTFLCARARALLRDHARCVRVRAQERVGVRRRVRLQPTALPFGAILAHARGGDLFGFVCLNFLSSVFQFWAFSVSSGIFLGAEREERERESWAQAADVARGRVAAYRRRARARRFRRVSVEFGRRVVKRRPVLWDALT